MQAFEVRTDDLTSIDLPLSPLIFFISSFIFVLFMYLFYIQFLFPLFLLVCPPIFPLPYCSIHCPLYFYPIKHDISSFNMTKHLALY